MDITGKPVQRQGVREEYRSHKNLSVPFIVQKAWLKNLSLPWQSYRWLQLAGTRRERELLT